MVQIIDEKRRLNTGQKLGQGLGKALSEVSKQFVSQGLEKKENEAIKNKTGLDLTGIRDPQTRQALLQDQFQYGRRLNQAQASQNIDYLTNPSRSQADDLKGFTQTGSISPPDQGSFLEKIRSQSEAPTKIQIEQPENQPTERVEEQRIPSTSMRSQGQPQQAPPQTPMQQYVSDYGKFLESETKGRKVPVLSPEEIITRGGQIAQQSTSMGIPMSQMEGIQIAQQLNSMGEAFNSKVDAEKLARAQQEELYGKNAEAIGGEFFKPEEYKPELRSYARRIGEEAASKQGATESSVMKEVSTKMRTLKDRLAGIRRLPKSEYFYQGSQKGLGQEQKFDNIKRNLRERAQPLLDEGLGDLVASELVDLNYDPETAQVLTYDLEQPTIKEVNDLPPLEYEKGSVVGSLLSKGLNILEKTPAGSAYTGVKLAGKMAGLFPESRNMTPESFEKLQSNLNSVLKNNPRANLVLLRKAYEKRGVDWRDFNMAVNNAIEEGSLELSPDQNTQKNIINEPPLHPLWKFLQGFKISL